MRLENACESQATEPQRVNKALASGSGVKRGSGPISSVLQRFLKRGAAEMCNDALSLLFYVPRSIAAQIFKKR